MEQLYNSTIAAISTAMSNSGIGIVRMSGPEAFQIADRVYKGKKEKKLCEQQSHTIHYGYMVDGDQVIDEVLVRGSMKDTALNYIKGFMAVSLFSVLPINLYSLSVSLQSSFGSALSGITNTESIGMTAQEALTSAVLSAMGDPIVQIFCVIMMGYAVIKVFFGNLKRGGILVIQIAVGSLYMFSVPRGYIDGFTQWCKQVIGICLTAFLQATILTAGLMIFKDHPLLGLGIMLSAAEVPRIAGQFGMDTSTRANLMSGVYAAQAAINISKTIVKVVAA